MGRVRPDGLSLGFDRAIKLVFHGAKVSSDTGSFPYRDLDEAIKPTSVADSRPARSSTYSQTRLVYT